MGIHVLYDPDYGLNGCAVFVCSTTDWAFGPLITSGVFDIPKGSDHYFHPRDIAQCFLEWLEKDPRTLSDDLLESRWTDFIGIGIDLCIECSGVKVKTKPFCSDRCAEDRAQYLRDQAEDIAGFANV